MAQTVLLALDADSAGQEAMLKASRLAARRKLELRVVELPAGADPAELVQQGGAEAIETAVEQAAPFVRFRVERVLASGDDSSPEGRDRMIAELRPVFETLPPSAMRMELTRLVSGRLGLSEGLAETLLASGGPPRAGDRVGTRQREHRPDGRAPPRWRDSAPIAVVEVGAGRQKTGFAREPGALRACGHRACVSGALHRHAPIWRAGACGGGARRRVHQRPDAPRRRAPEGGTAGRAAQRRRRRGPRAGRPARRADGRSGTLAGVGGSTKPPMLEVQQLQLQLAWIDRRIHTARAQGVGEVSDLARLRGRGQAGVRPGAGAGFGGERGRRGRAGDTWCEPSAGGRMGQVPANVCS